MKVNLIRQFFDGYISYRCDSFDWCCDEIKSNPLIALAKHDFDYDSDYCDDVEDCSDCNSYDKCCMPSMTILYSNTFSEWENDVHYKINYCPFCGKPIEINVVGEEDVSEYIAELRIKRDEAYDRCKKTDSIKESRELQKKIYELDEEINYFYKYI